MVVAKASGRYIRISPQKTRLVIDLIKGKRVSEALTILRFSKKRAAKEIEQVLLSAIANAEQKLENVDVDNLVVSRAYVDQGPTMKRYRFRAMGRVYRILKRMSHITVELSELVPATVAKGKSKE
ncbi:MAG: 50S ribosomal protein L22 [Acidobacteria bacterium]|nr:50S ribosomal protein L22 [Acidobacteriota bacterium]